MFPRKTFRWPKANEKTLHITNPQGNANQSTVRYRLTPIRVAVTKKVTNSKCRQGRGEGALLHCWQECEPRQPPQTTVGTP